MVALKENCRKTTTETLQEHLEDRFWRLNNLYWILTEQGSKVRFVMNTVQVMLYRALWWLNIIPKSRQHGITTFISIFMLDACLFNSDVRAGIIAHKLTDAKKIFRDKIKFAFNHLPEDLKAQFYDETGKLPKDDAQELLFSNNSSIYVGTSMRSGTLQYLHVSEYGWLCTHAPKKAAEIKSGAMETVHEGGMIFLESTVEGPSGDFPDMCREAELIRVSKRKLGPMDYKIHFFAWWQKPSNVTDPQFVSVSDNMHQYFDKVERTNNIELSKPERAWYTAKKKTLGSLIWGQHPSTLDESFLSRIVGSYYGESFAWLQENGRIGDVPHNPSYPVYLVCDPGYTSAWWALQVMPTGYVHFLRYYEDTGKDFGFYATLLARWKAEHNYRYQSVGYAYAPYDIDNNQYKLVDSGGLLEVARRAGIDFVQMEMETDVLLGIAKTNQFLKMCRFNEEGCSIGINKCRAYHESINIKMSTDDKPVFTGIPAKDGNDHAADCLRYVRKAISMIESKQEEPEKQKDWQALKRKYA